MAGRGDNCAALFREALTLERDGEFDRAFAVLAEANRLAASPSAIALAVAREDAVLEEAKRSFTVATLGRSPIPGHLSTAPIFVVGKPRSGTTLIEQILATHPDVEAMGEATALSAAIGASRAWSLADDAFYRVGAEYLTQMRVRGWMGAPRFVDKLPQNYWHVATIALALPGATILHSVRDPMDTCFSHFRQVFEEGNELTYDLAEIGHSYVRYRRLMEHWAQVLPGRVIDVRHEDLVADPERMIRWLVTEACGLPWDERCLHFYENDRPVFTASRDQVRQPIFTTSIGRWRNYEKHLGPLIEALGSYGPGAS